CLPDLMTLAICILSLHDALPILLFERVRHKDMVVLGIAVIGARAGNVVDPVVRVATSATRCISSGYVLRCASRGRARCGLLSEELGHSAQESGQCCNSANKTASSIASHEVSPSLSGKSGLLFFILHRFRNALQRLFSNVPARHNG